MDIITGALVMAGTVAGAFTAGYKLGVWRGRLIGQVLQIDVEHNRRRKWREELENDDGKIIGWTETTPGTWVRIINRLTKRTRESIDG